MMEAYVNTSYIPRPYADSNLTQEDVRDEICYLNLRGMENIDLQFAGMNLQAAIAERATSSVIREAKDRLVELQMQIGDEPVIRKLLTLVGMLTTF
jgi:hypothetical protein